jgi:hypothetical protein
MIPIPTHRCKICGALWKLWQTGEAGPGQNISGVPGRGSGGWTLVSSTCEKCCDNQVMGQQIDQISVTIEPLKSRVVLRSPCCGDFIEADLIPHADHAWYGVMYAATCARCQTTYKISATVGVEITP